MIDKQISWNITLGDALLINNNEFVNIPIDIENYIDIFVNNYVSNQVIKLLNANRRYFDNKLHDSLNKDFDYGIEISMHPNFDKTSYEIGYDLNEIFYNIFKKIDLTFYKKDYDFDDENEVQRFKESVIDQLENGKLLDLLTKTDPEFYNSKYDIDMQVIFNLENNIDTVVDQMYKTNMSIKDLINKQVAFDQKRKEDHHRIVLTYESLIIPKNLLLYTAGKALHIFEKTGDIDYYRYCKDYYRNISCPRENGRRPEYPNWMTIDDAIFGDNYDDYNSYFTRTRYGHFPRLYVDLDKEDLEKYTKQDRTLKKGQQNQVIKLNGNSTPKKKIDYSKANKALERKITFYKGLKNVGLIDSVDRELDYIGFVLDNNYVILDKFYDLNKDGSIKKPAMNNAVYVVTLDVLEACDYSKKKIRDYIAKNHDFKAFRWNHNDTDSYQEKIKKVLTYTDISLKKFEDIKK